MGREQTLSMEDRQWYVYTVVGSVIAEHIGVVELALI